MEKEYDETDCTDIINRFLALRPESGTDLGFIATVGHRYLSIFKEVWPCNCPLHEVVHYCAGSKVKLKRI